MSAHPTVSASGHAHHQRIGGYVAGDDGAGGDECVLPDGRTAHDRRIRSDGRAYADNRFLDGVSAVDLPARIDDIRKYTARSEEDVVLDNGARTEHDIVENVDVVANDDAIRDYDILPQAACLTYLGVRHDVREMPDLRPLANFAGNVNKRRWVNEIVRFHVVPLFREIDVGIVARRLRVCR